MRKSIIGAVCACLAVVSFNVSAALIERLGGLAYYDDVANLTWLADANAAVGSAYDTYDPGSGRMNWADANTWAAGLNVAGVTGWRLPDTIDAGNDGATRGVDTGYNITTHSEMSNMYYNVLGNLAYEDTNGNIQPGYGLSNTGPFSNLLSQAYWSATEESSINTNYAWYFANAQGNQGAAYKSINYIYAWAVQSGDVGGGGEIWVPPAVVPVPAAAWLFGSGLIGLVGLARRKTNA